MRVEHVIIGAGLAGLVLARVLGPRALLIDPNPGGYKIGESLIPELFRHPLLAALLPRVRALPSCSPKEGTTFASEGQVAFFPLAPSEAALSMHVARPELEGLMLEAWELEVTRARITAIDWDRKRVETTAGPVDYTGLVLDCSGPAMVVATLRGEVEQLARVHATWGYHDITALHEGAWARALAAEGGQLRSYDARHRRLLTLEEAGAWQPSRTTALVRIDAGVWLWQIPLARESLLSYGVVSRHGSIDEATYRSITAAHASPEFTLRGPRLDDAGPFSRLHRRDGFARQARTPADRDFILLADACAFSDPVYSVGAGFAVNTALQIAELLARGPWTRDACEAYCRRSRALMDRARAAFEFWYSGELLASPAAAREVQDAMLRGELFHEQLSGHYGDVLADSEYSGARDPFAPRVGAESLAPAARALLEIDDELVGWRLVGADPSESGVTLRFQRDALPILTVMVGRADGERCFQVIGPLALSYMQPAEGSYPDSPAFRGLLDAVATRLSRRADAWVALVDGDLSPAAASA